ncbi:MAG TPA: ATP-binding cassette domain-containing protein [Candidatus Onthoplasma faecigallinarum]|nr:ATP-binding cassette domain-containing protein [Candidatus Onthoplasma faecigallinarum]
MIKFDHVYLKYINEFYTLYDINLELKENTLILGDIFDGTHSLFRLISKIDRNYQGEIYIEDKNLKDIKDKDLSLSYVTDKPYLFENKNIYKNLYYPLKIRKINKIDAKNMINDAINLYKLNNFPQKIKDMTLWQKKIIALVRAIIRRPKYILLEDFFSNLDEEYYEIATNILSSCDSTIIACEKTDTKIPYYDSFNKLNLSYGKLEDAVEKAHCS